MLTKMTAQHSLYWQDKMNDLIYISRIIEKLNHLYSNSVAIIHIPENEVLNYSHISWSEGKENFFTEEDFIKIIEEEDSLLYREKRKAEYPSIGDQLDDLFKKGFFSEEMTNKIQSVKDKYPKGLVG